VKPGVSLAAPEVIIAQPTDTFIFMPVYIARGKGYFKDEGLNVKVVVTRGGSKAAAALIGGSVQFVAGAFAHNVKAAGKGRRIVAVAGLMNQIPSNVFLGKKAAKERGVTSESPLATKIKALKGLRIGITRPGSMTDLLVRHLVSSQGMNPDRDLSIVALGGARASLSAMSNGAIDAVVQASPTLETMEDRGLGKTFINITNGEVKDLRGFLFSSINTTRKYMDKNPGIVLKVVKAIVRAERFLESDPKGALNTLRPFFKRIKQKVFEQSFKNIVSAIKKDPTIFRPEVEKNIFFINLGNKNAGLKKVEISFDQVVTNKFVIQAKKELGIN
jgi:NitT/TauT family transport system substrate-binding protein